VDVAAAAVVAAVMAAAVAAVVGKFYPHPKVKKKAARDVNPEPLLISRKSPYNLYHF
jgi:hypothetical protein